MSLRATAADDLDRVLAMEQHPDNREWLLAWDRDRHQRSLGEPGIRHLVARDAAGGTVGFAILAAVDDPHRSIECRRLVISRKGCGYGRALLRALLAMAFDELGAHRLWLDTQERNHRALRLYRSEGFVREGVLRECWRQHGAWQSLVVLSLLAREYRAARRGH